MMTSYSRPIHFPAMETMISEMSVNELLVLSGFIHTCIESDINEMARIVEDFVSRDGEMTPNNADLLHIVQQSRDAILSKTHTILLAITKRLYRLREIGPAQSDGQTDKQLQERLRRAFPGMAI